jgi:peptide/nickel transport system ATP-binding protein
MSALLEIADLSIAAEAATGPRTILSSVDLVIGEGETVGIVGESGSGKSMTAKAVMGLLPPRVKARGSIRYHGRELLTLSDREMGRIRGPEISLLMQDPFTMLNPLMPCGEHIVEGLVRVMPGAGKRALWAEAVKRLAEVGIRDEGVAYRYPFQLSGGMRQRVALAAALANNPKLLIADEPSTALDVTTQAEILKLLADLQKSRGMALLLITHDLRVAFSVCNRVHVFYAGRVLEAAPAAALSAEPLHPYSLGLLLSEPDLRHRSARLDAIPGSVPMPDRVAESCAFAPRCEWRRPECVAARPPLEDVGERLSACVRLDAIRGEMRAKREAAHVAADAIAIPAARGVGAPLLVVENARKEFEARRGGKVVALSGVSLRLEAGESVGIVGESGSGKTTLGRCVVGLETLTSGRITIDGVDGSNFAKSDVATRRKLRGTAQIVFQDPYSSLNPRHKVGAMLAETLSVNGAVRSAIPGRIGELLDMVGLPRDYAQRYPRALSGGERQRVAIARALAVEPKLIVCDEPVSALDVSVQAQILTLLRDLRQRLGLSYLFITHDLAVVRQVVDRIYVLYRAELVEEGPVDQILDAPREAYTRRLIASIPGQTQPETRQE